MTKNNSEDIPWWKKTVIYQIYPRSFYDSNNDGVGDIEGVISKLDYLNELGIETIWLSPFFKSPQKDFGYDISDFTDVDPKYGDMDLCNRLINEVHNRDMKIVFDLVLNHTSDQHPWFIESRSNRDNPKRDWYIWCDGKGKNPPNNWRSMIGGSGWHYDKHTDQWYWAQFLPFQPDLNYRNPEVKETMLNIIRYWLKKKVDGFRLDIIDALFEDPHFRNNPMSIKFIPSDSSTNRFFLKSTYTLDHPDTIDFMKELRSVVDEFDNPSRFLVGEIISDIETTKRYCGDKGDGLHSVFLFQGLRIPHKAKKLEKFVKTIENNFHSPYAPTWFFSNHDRIRRITRIGNDIKKAKLTAAFQLTVKGIPCIYYGEEIGMESPRMSNKNSLDAMVRKYNWIPQIFFDVVRKVGIESFNRDEQRTPMQWNSSENAGFCDKDVKPWLPVSSSFKERNVTVQKDDLDSLLNCYKRFLKVRKEYSVLNSGSLRFIDTNNKNVLAYKRLNNYSEKAFIFLNFSNKKIKIKNKYSANRLLASTYHKSNPLNGNYINLRAQEGIILTNG